MRFDYHTHHERCGHAIGSVADYVEAALALGMEEIGISDHAPVYWREGDHALPGSAMARSELGAYVDEVLEVKSRFAGRIAVRLGLEADFAPGFEDVYRDVLARYPFDYVIGSVHYCQDLHIYWHGRWDDVEDASETYAEYFRLIRASARSGLFDVLGHITGLMIYGPIPPREFLERQFDETARAIAESGVAIEVNTSGLRKGGPGPFPDGELLRRCIAAGVPITYGSDAHHPSEVGHAREVALGLLRGANVWQPGRG